MGRKGKFFSAIKKVFSPESKEKKLQFVQKSCKSTNKLGDTGQIRAWDPSNSESFENGVRNLTPADNSELRIGRDEQSKNVYSEASASETVRDTCISLPDTSDSRDLARFGGKSDVEVAAIKIQTAFRGYVARRALRALRGLVRLKSLIHGNACKRQTSTTLRCMQTLARVQSQIRSRRTRMLEENLALQRQLLLKREKELENLKMGDQWDDSIQSKEQIESSLLSKQEAGIRRERALAYAFTHQGKNGSKSANPMFMNPNNPQWGWSWLERWIAAHPWEARTATADKDNSTKNTPFSLLNRSNEITKSYALTKEISPSTPKSYRSPKPQEDDVKSMIAIKMEKNRRHSVAGSSIGDDESIGSSLSVPSYMAPTKSAKARSRFSSPNDDELITEGLERAGGGSAVKKKLIFPPGPGGGRRHSGPPKVDLAKVKSIAVSAGE